MQDCGLMGSVSMNRKGSFSNRTAQTLCPSPSAPVPLYDHRPEAVERAALGALLLDSRSIDPTLLSEDDFSDGRHQHIFRAVMGLLADGAPVNLVTVTDSLRMRGALKHAGNASYLTSLLEDVFGTGQFSFHASLLHAATARKALLTLGEQLVESSKIPDFSLVALRALAQSVLDALAAGRPSDALVAHRAWRRTYMWRNA